MKNLLGAIIAVVLVGGGLRVLYSRVTSAATQDQSTCLVLAGSTTSGENNQTYITGTIRNDCDRRFFTVTVTFKVSQQSLSFGNRNNNDNTTHDMLISAYARNLAAGESVEFKTSSFMNMVGYQLDSIHGF